MALWDIVLVGFDPEDETSNFGTRVFAETKSAIYETETRSTIQALDKDSLVSVSPQVISMFNECGDLAVAVDRSLTIFSPDRTAPPRFSVSFDTVIDSLFLASEFVFLGLSSGALRCFHLPTNGTLIFLLNLNTGDVLSGTPFFTKIISRQSKDQLEIIAVSSNGNIYSIDGFNTKSINDAIQKADNGAMDECKKNLQIVQLPKSKYKGGNICCSEKQDLILVGDRYLKLLLNDKSWADILTFEPEFSVKTVLCSISNFIVCLTTDGSLLFYCPYTLQLMFVWSEEKIKDCTVLESDFQGSRVHKLLVLTASEVQPKLILMSLRDFDIEFRLKVKRDSFLVKNQSTSENFMFLEGHGEEKVDTIRVKSLIETHPEHSLNRLLQKGKFEVAKEFALRYRLNFELINKSKANWLMEELQPWKNSRNVHITELIDTLELIKDDKFVLECCIKTIPPDLDSTHSLLCYATKRLQRIKNKDDTYDIFMTQISNLLLRLGTFMQIYKDHQSATEQWIYFSTANLATICLQHLSKGEIKEAIIICTRHWSQHIVDEYTFSSKMQRSQELAIGHLTEIPSFVGIKEITEWLTCFVPRFLAYQPHMLPQLVSWVEDKTKFLELEEPNAWPKIGLDFCTGVLHLLITAMESSSCNSSLARLQQGLQRADSPLNQMHSVIATLGQLATLKNQHSIRVPFDRFAQNPSNKEGRKEVIWLLFDSVSIEGIPRLLKDFIELYCHQSFIEVDSVITAYIKEVCTSLRWWGAEAMCFESRFISLINCIKSVDVKMESILTLVRDVPVPWSAEVEGLVEEAIKLKHQLSGEVYLEKKNVVKKLVFKKYDLPLNTSLTEMFQHVNLIRYIYRQSRAEMLEDAKMLVGSEDPKSYLDIYVYYFLYCIQNSDITKGLNILDSELSKDQQIIVYEHILYFLRMKNRFKEPKYYYINVLPALISRVSKLNSVLAVQYNNLKAVEILKVEYNMNVDFEKISFPDVRQQTLEECTKKIISCVDENKKMEISDKSKLLAQAAQVASLLNFSNEEGILEMALYCSLNPNTFNHSTELVRELILTDNINKCDTSRLYSLAYSILLRFAEINDPPMNILTDVYELLCQVVMNCKPYNLWKFMELIKVVRLFTDLPVKASWAKFYDDSLGSSSLSKLPSCTIPVLLKCASSTCKLEIGSEDTPDRKLEYLVKIIKGQPSSLASLKNILTLYSLASTAFSLDERTLQIAANVVMTIVSDLGLKVISAQQLDVDLALSLLNFFEPENAVQWLLNISKNYPSELLLVVQWSAVNVTHTEDDLKSKYLYFAAQTAGVNRLCSGNRLRNIRAVSLVGQQYCQLHNIDQYMDHFNNLYRTCKWAQKLYKYGIPTREVFKDAGQGKKNQLLTRLMDVPGVDLPLLWEYCKDMQIDQHECMLLYLERTLLKWNPVFKVVPNHESGKSDIILETKRNQLLRECWRIMASIRNPENVFESFMRSLWSRVNYYNYECFDVIIKLIEGFYKPRLSQDIYGPQKLLLSFLNNYKRISPPQEQEVENWSRSFPDSQRMPPISRYRLPFTPLPAEQWEFIRPELSLSTYQIWLDVPSWFNVILNKDLICTITINNLKNEEAVVSRSGWEVNFTKKKLMEQIMECIGHIRNLEMSTTALYFVVNHVLPQGVDQVDAVQKCYMHAQEWEAVDCSQKSREGLMKAKKKYLTISTMYILHKHGLGRPEYLNLVLEPTELITALYNDPSILQRSSTYFAVLPDINKAVERIAALHNVSIIAIRLELLSEWLQPDNSLNYFNETIPSNSNQELSDSENIKRACYVLSADVFKAGSYLVGLAFPHIDESAGLPVAVRLRALNCLLEITTCEEMETITARTFSQIRAYKLSLELVCELERLGMSCSILCFDSCSKPELVRMLLVKDQEPAALQLAARLCTVYRIDSPQFWNQIFHRMTALSMFSELGKLLLQTIDMFPTLDQDILVNAWNYVIISYSAKANGGVAGAEGKVTELLTACPLVRKLDTEAILERLGPSKAASIITAQHPVNGNLPNETIASHDCNGMKDEN